MLHFNSYNFFSSVAISIIYLRNENYWIFLERYASITYLMLSYPDRPILNMSSNSYKVEKLQNIIYIHFLNYVIINLLCSTTMVAQTAFPTSFIFILFIFLHLWLKLYFNTTVTYNLSLKKLFSRNLSF